MDERQKQRLEDALIKKAVGYESTETVDEYSLCDGEMTLTKRKVTHKDVPPDMSAIKYLLGEGAERQVSIEELERERAELVEKYLKLYETEQ